MAGLKIGPTDISDVRIGSTQVEKVYLGSTEVWTSTIMTPFVWNQTDASQFDVVGDNTAILTAEVRSSWSQLSLYTEMTSSGGDSLQGFCAPITVTPGQLYRITVKYSISNATRFNGSLIGVYPTSAGAAVFGSIFGANPDSGDMLTGYRSALPAAGTSPQTYTCDFTSPTDSELYLLYAMYHKSATAGNSTCHELRIDAVV